MLTQNINLKTGDKTGKDDTNMFEDETIDKPKAAKCYIKEVNNNREDDVIEDQNCLLTKNVNFQIWQNKQKTLEIPLSVFGFSNPFQPYGCVSEDGELIVRMWKEKRLAELYDQTDQTVTEHGEADEDGENTDKGSNKEGTLNVSFVKNENVKETTRADTLKNGKRKEKFKSLCCSVM